WTIPVLVLSAVQNAALEEVVVVGYLMTRLRQLAWRTPWVVAMSGGLGGAFVGNALMGVVFSLVYVRWRRVMPLVVAHAILDMVAFVGYTLAKDHVDWLR